MKTVLKIVGSLIVLCILMAFTTITRSFENKEIALELKTFGIIIPEVKINSSEFKIETRNHDDFLDAIGFKESGNRYDIVNKYGYMGRYQFGIKTLRGLGYKVSKEEFLSSPEIQESAMEQLLLHNKEKLSKFIEKYEGEVVNGIYITESGILAAAHLGGAGSVRRWFNKGVNFQDGNGTKITTYMKVFNGYQLDLP